MTRRFVVHVRHSRSPEEIRKGLMFRRSPLRKNHGMLFHTGRRISRFWMKDTFIPLDVVFLNRNFRVVGYVQDTCPHSLAPITIGRPSSFVLEMNAGWVRRNGVRVGDVILPSE